MVVRPVAVAVESQPDRYDRRQGSLFNERICVLPGYELVAVGGGGSTVCAREVHMALSSGAAFFTFFFFFFSCGVCDRS